MEFYINKVIDVQIDTPYGRFSFDPDAKFYVNDSLVLVDTTLHKIMIHLFDSVLVFKTDRLIPPDSSYLYREYKRQYELLKDYHESMLKRWGIKNDGALKKQKDI